MIPNLSLQRSALFIATLLLLSCTRQKDPGASTLKLQLPPHPNYQDKSADLTRLSESPGFETFCYAVNITGGDIQTSTKNCFPAVGVSSGFKPPLSTIELDVKQGDGRSIEVFGYWAKAGEKCDGRSIQSVDLNRLYLMGSISSINIREPTVSVSILVNFPGASNNVAVTSQQSSTCTANFEALPNGGSTAVITGGRLKGSKYALNASVARGQNSSVQSGSKYKISSEVNYVRK